MNNNKNIKTLALLAVLGGNVIFGFSFLFSKIALDIVKPSVLVAVRFTVAFIVLNLVVIFGKLIFGESFAFSLKGKPKKPVLLLGLCQPVIYFAGESYGIKLTSSAFSGIIIALIPIVGILADAFIMHSKIGKKQVICAILSVVGVSLTTYGARNLESSALGLVCLLVAVIAGAFFYVFSKRAGEYYNPLERTYVMFGMGSVTYALAALAQEAGHYEETAAAIMTPAFWAAIAYLAVVSSVAAFLLLNFGSSHVSVSGGTLMANTTTVISIIAGVVVLKESFTLPQIIGAVIIISSVTVGELMK